MSHNRIVMLSAFVALSLSVLAPTGASAGAVLAHVTNHAAAFAFSTSQHPVSRPPERPPAPRSLTTPVVVHPAIDAFLGTSGGSTGGGSFGGGGGGSGSAGHPKQAASK